MDRKIGVRKMNPLMTMGMKRTMPKNMFARKKGNMISRQEYHSPPKEEREEERDMEEEKMTERRSVKNGIEKMKRKMGNSSYS
tara:strand:- start:2022 stop:2270 length:249 start_codon:yes stop_codon:yes gene_type:complete